MPPIFLCSDFEKPLNISSSKNDIIAIQLVDPAEQELPRVGKVRLSDPETGKNSNHKKQTLKQFVKLIQEIVISGKTNLDQIFESNGVDKITLSTNNEPDAALSLRNFFKKRKT